jgi:hypothetical protein
MIKQNINKRQLCEKWDIQNKSFQTCDVSVYINPLQQIVLNGNLKEPLRSQLLSLGKQVYIQYWAPSPPENRHSLSGSRLPFPCEDIAFSNSPNIGRSVLGKDASFNIKMNYPNGYYKNLGSEYVNPNVKLLVSDEEGNIYGKIISVPF